MINHHPECRACETQFRYERCRDAMQNSIDAIRDVADAIHDINITVENIDDNVAYKEQLLGHSVLLYARVDEVITSTDAVFGGITDFANSVDN
jgi:hypothetical protein